MLLVNLAVFGLADWESADEYGATNAFEKGWNLVSVYAFPDAFEGRIAELNKKQLNNDGIRGIFFYDKYLSKRYIQLYPNYETEKMNALKDYLENDRTDSFSPASSTASSMWVYSNKKQEKTYATTDGPPLLSSMTLKAGWNFLSVTPQMIGKKLADIKGNCNVLRAYAWDPRSQQWASIINISFDDEGLGMGFVIQVSSNCKLGASENTANPPAPPNLPQGDNTGLRKNIESYYYQEYSYEECTLNNAKEYTSKSDCETAWKCISIDYAKLIPETDLQDLANYMKAHGGEGGDGYYRDKNPSIASQMNSIFSKCLAGKHIDY